MCAQVYVYVYMSFTGFASTPRRKRKVGIIAFGFRAIVFGLHALGVIRFRVGVERETRGTRNAMEHPRGVKSREV